MWSLPSSLHHLAPPLDAPSDGLVTKLYHPCDPMDCSPPGSSVHGISQARILEVGCHFPLQGIFPIQGSNPSLLHCRWILYHRSHQLPLLHTLNALCPSSVRKSLSVQFSSVSHSCLTLCDPMDCSTPGLPVHHQLSEFTQMHVHWVGDAIQPSHPLLSPSPPTFKNY